MNASPFKWGGARVSAGGGVTHLTDLRMTPPSAYDAATSPFEWGGERTSSAGGAPLQWRDLLCSTMHDAPLEWRAPSL
jgi:hypothetical protein